MMPETAKIILAVLVIIGLIYLAVVLLNIFKDNNRQEQSKATLEEMNSIFNRLSDNEEKDFTYLAPKDWFIKDIKILNPAQSLGECKSEYCLCFCKDIECNDVNSCKEFKKDVVIRNVVGDEVDSYELSKVPKTFSLKNESNQLVVIIK